jgi:environmental stress-induced protein Ves
MRLLAAASSRRVPWKNGLGSTLEVATDAAAPGGEWTWRLSIADVPARAPFSAFPGIDRFIACLEGPGLDLERPAGVQRAPSAGEALAFPGEEAVTGVPLGPGVRDVNLMLRRGRWSGRMTLVRETALGLEAPVVVVHALAGTLSLESPEGKMDLRPGHTAVARGRIAIREARGGVAVACELRPR